MSGRTDEVPFAPDAEKAVLGAILLDGAIPDAGELRPQLFFSPSNREIFIAMQAITARGDLKIDPITVMEELRRAGRLDAVGVPYLSDIPWGAIRSDFPSALKILSDTYAKRKIWVAANRAADEALNGHPPGQIIADLRAAIDDADQVAPNGWAKLQPLPGGHLPAPKLRPEMIPGSFRLWVADIAERLQVPLDFPTIPALISFAAVVGAKIRMRPQRYGDWTVVPNLWGAVVGDPGMLKSPSIEQATKPLRRLVATAEERLKKQAQQYALDKEVDDERRAEIKKKIKAAIQRGEGPAAIAALQAELGDPLEEPKEKRYLVNDATVEVLGVKLAENTNGLLLLRDELTGWLKQLDKEGNANERAFYLESWNGGSSYIYDRIGRGTLKIPNNTMSVLGGIQPGPLVKYVTEARENAGGADGLLQRLQLLIWPDELVDYRLVDRWPDNEAKNRAYQVFEWADGLSTANFAGREENYSYLRFEPDAQEIFDAWYTELQRRIRGREMDPAFKSHLAKFGSLFASLSLLFHLIDCYGLTDIPPVGVAATKRAVYWVDYLEGHTRKIHNLTAGEADEAVLRLADKLKQRRLADGFQVRDVLKKEWKGLTDALSATRAIDTLCELHWLRKVEVESKVRGGKAKIIFEIHPDVEIQ